MATALKFPLGRTVITRGALAELTQRDVCRGLSRHESGDWGDLCNEDRSANDRALRVGERLLSAYQSAAGVKFWIITEWDRSIKTVLLPEEY